MSQLFIKWNLMLCLSVIISCNQNSDKTDVSMGFTLLEPSHTGIRFQNLITESLDQNIYYSAYMFNGGGVATADFNNDGLLDLYFSGNQVADQLYLNKGEFKFEDISKESGISKFKGWKNGISIVDINEDGWLDIYICRGDHDQSPSENTNLLLINQGDLTFLESAAEYGIDDDGYSICSVFFDMDNDNDLDLYISNRPERFNRTFKQMDEEMELNIRYGQHRLYRNNGKGHFSEISTLAGITNTYGYGLNVIAGDFNSDGWQDLFVCNDFRWPDFYYENQKNGTFKEKMKEFANHSSFSSMGADLGDINNDGMEDLFVVEMRPDDYKRSKTSMPTMNPQIYDTMKSKDIHLQFMHNALYLNRGSSYFSEISQLSGVDKTDWSWAPLIADFDHDGLRDIYVTNGFRRDLNDLDGDALMDSLVAHKRKFNSLEDLFAIFPKVPLVNYMFKNAGHLKFDKVMTNWGFTKPSYSNGAATADLDNDGDLDLVINNIDDHVHLYRNNNPFVKQQIRVSCKGPTGNPMGIGAKIELFSDSLHTSADMRIQRAYLSCSEPTVHFGLGNCKKIDSLRIRWPDGKTETIRNIKMGSNLIFNYQNASPTNQISEFTKSYFSNISSQSLTPAFYHRENQYNDFSEQKLLPYEMSRLGPFITVADVNQDGLEDFYVGGAKNQSGALYLQNSLHQFILSNQKVFIQDQAYEDMGTLFFDVESDGDMDLYVVSGGTESPEGRAYQDRIYLNNGKGQFTKGLKNIPLTSSSGSCLQVFDADGDGDLDIFRGGRVIPSKYPSAPKSYFFRNEGQGHFTDQTNQFLGELATIGMITSVASLDINQDSKPDLIVGGEWMSLQVWENSGAGFRKTNPEKYGFENTEGMWFKIHAEDLNQDGLLDLICGNIGENYKFHASNEKPFLIYANDFDQNQTFDIVLSKFEGESRVPIRGKQCSQEQMPFIKKKFPSFKLFAAASLEDIYGPGLEKAVHYQAKEFKSLIFINKGKKFERQELPVEVQFSAVHGILTYDINSDHQMDIVLAGNYFKTEVETSPLDASVGLVLLANSGKFIPLTIAQSGVFLKTDVKDLHEIKIGDSFGFLASSNDGPLQLVQHHK
ncbi:MAG: VCBS repeat-containing protein [Saprospiraceae bacterium]|nr:VCBS repeat-containing protein [Saprospiraceae bacterium]